MPLVQTTTEDMRNGLTLETRLYEGGYGTISLIDSLGFELRQFESHSHGRETVEEFHDRLVELLQLDGDQWLTGKG